MRNHASGPQPYEWPIVDAFQAGTEDGNILDCLANQHILYLTLPNGLAIESVPPSPIDSLIYIGPTCSDIFFYSFHNHDPREGYLGLLVYMYGHCFRVCLFDLFSLS